MNNKENQIKSFFIKSTRIISVLIISLGIASCSSDMYAEPELTNNEIYGLWTDTIKTTEGRYVYNLTFRPNGTFLSTTLGLGFYDKQEENEMSFYSDEQGNYVQSARNIYFLSKNTTEWDAFKNQPPVSNDTSKVIFESCSYEIIIDTLTLKYISYPADAPELTTRKYIRKTQQPD
ncbi:MAG: hypothetical protein JXR27_07085 [Paludibacteraceae bacterium]|nr:hypothetical protein [Paludibacteraceae bacterium]